MYSATIAGVRRENAGIDDDAVFWCTASLFAFLQTDAEPRWFNACKGGIAKDYFFQRSFADSAVDPDDMIQCDGCLIAEWEVFRNGYEKLPAGELGFCGAAAFPDYRILFP